MSNPYLIDPGQVLTSVYDGDNDALRVELTAGISLGAVELKDGSSGNLASINNEGELAVRIGDPSAQNFANVKAGSTPAGASDNSLVVAISPNSPVPTGTNTIGSINNINGTVSLPTGAATSALQTSGNSTLSTIATNTTGVSTAANQATEISSLASIVTNTTGISTAANQTTGNNTLSSIASDLTNASQKSQIVDGSGNVIGSTSNALNIFNTTASTLPTGAATSALQTSGNSTLTTIASDLTNGTQVTSVNNFPATQAISATALPLPTGASTSALQTSGNTSLSSILTNQTNGTQVTSVNNFPATQAVSGTVAVSNFPATQPVSATSLPLPTGAATSANQATEISSLSTIATNTTGVSTSANQTTANTSLASIATNQTSGSQKTQISTPTALTLHQAAVTVGTTAVQATVSGSAPASTRVLLVITPDPASTSTFYIGSSSVTNSGSTRGIAIVAGQAFIANNDAAAYYIVSSAASQTVEILEQY